METVAFYSYKGGVGRSLLLVNTARFLALTGRRVVALDLDFEAPGLHYKLGVEEKVETGAVRLLQRSLDGDLPTIDEIRKTTVDVPMPATHGGWLRLLAAGPAPTAEYWADLGRLHELLVASQDAGLLEAVLDLQARIEEAWNPDVLLVDARTGVTGLGGIATMALCDRVVLMTTRSKESLDGIRAVADSLRATPTLRGGERRLECVVSRVQGTEAVDEEELRKVLGEYFELPHDRYDGGAERLFGDGPRPPVAHFTGPESVRSATAPLLSRVLLWISRQFPTQADDVYYAYQRLRAVEQAWVELTETNRSEGGFIPSRPHWPTDMLATNVTFSGADGSTRTADIVARLDSGDLAMIFEYVDEEPDLDVAHWWTEHVSPRVIVLQWAGDLRGDDEWLANRMFIGKDGPRDYDSEYMKQRWDLPSPEDFAFLRDPADRSLDAMLEAATQTDFYDNRLIADWVWSTLSHDDFRLKPRPARARKVLQGLAMIEDAIRAAQVVDSCSDPDLFDLSLHTADDYVDRLIQEGLSAPLCWRAPPRAFIDLTEAGGREPPHAFYALRHLASFMGLGYDPEALRRRETAKLVGDDDASIDSVMEALRARDLMYEWSADLFATTPNEPGRRPPGYHGHLGSYTPATGRIVLAAPTIEAAAASLGRAPRHVGSVTLLHLSVLGMLHNGIDLDGQRWGGFSIDPMPPATVVLAQLFVHRFLLELDDEHLLDAFEALTDAQPPEYGAWRAMTHLSLEDARAWMMSLRRGTGAPAPIDLDALLRPR